MTERFTLTDWHEVKDNEKKMTVNEVVDMLNRQDYAIEVKQKYIEKLEKQLEQIPKNIKDIWIE